MARFMQSKGGGFLYDVQQGKKRRGIKIFSQYFRKMADKKIDGIGSTTIAGQLAQQAQNTHKLQRMNSIETGV
jgi:hypothetical protein